jgi:hypothetical protein
MWAADHEDGVGERAALDLIELLLDDQPLLSSTIFSTALITTPVELHYGCRIRVFSAQRALSTQRRS